MQRDMRGSGRALGRWLRLMTLALVLVVVLPGSRERTGRLLVEPIVVGRTPRLVGTNTGHWLPTTGMRAWLEDSGFNAVRIWASVGRLRTSSGTTRPAVDDEASFVLARAAVLASPHASAYIDWPAYEAAFSTTNTGAGSNHYALDYAVADARDIGLDVVLNLTPSPQDMAGATDAASWPSSWPDRWSWWLHCFVVAYHLDVDRQLGVRYFEIDNEPEARLGRHPGAEDGYLREVDLAADAVRHAVAPGPRADVTILAPVAERPDSPLIGHLLRNAPGAIDAIDYHRYHPDPDLHAAGIPTVRATERDAVAPPRPIFVTEWGTSSRKIDPRYDESRLGTALLDARIMRAYALAGVEALLQFKFERTWGDTLGLLVVEDSGDHRIGMPTKAYFAQCMLARAMVGGREIVRTSEPGGPLETLATRLEPAHAIVTVINSGEIAYRLSVDTSLLGAHGEATVRLLDAEHDDVPIWAGLDASRPLAIQVPPLSIVQVDVHDPASMAGHESPASGGSS